MRLAYRRWGEPGARPVVLLHALGEDSGTWCQVGDALAASHLVYALDLRGHGESDHPAEYSLELLCADVAGAVGGLGLARVSVIGHSLGGMIGYLLATRRPGFLDRLVMEEAPPPLPIVPARPVPERPEGELPFDWNALEALYRQRNDPDPAWWERLADIEVPALVIGGGTSSHVDQDQLARMAARIPDCRLQTIDAGHNVHASRPDEFMAAIRAFLV